MNHRLCIICNKLISRISILDAEPARSSGRRSKPKFIQFITPLDSVPAQEVKPQVRFFTIQFKTIIKIIEGYDLGRRVLEEKK